MVSLINLVNAGNPLYVRLFATFNGIKRDKVVESRIYISCLKIQKLIDHLQAS